MDMGISRVPNEEEKDPGLYNIPVQQSVKSMGEPA
jgi:hypothetical protein